MTVNSEHNIEYMNDEKLDSLFNWEVIFPKLALVPLFYYRTAGTADKILREENIRLRLSRADYFADKQEGKTIKKYYDQALNELLAEGVLSGNWHSEFKAIEESKEIFIPVETQNGIVKWKDSEYKEFIICFSTVGDDIHMFEEFCRDRTGMPCEGYCFHFLDGTIHEYKHLGLKNHCDILFHPVLYGNLAVDLIKENLRNVISNSYYLDDYKYYIREIITAMRYFTKRSKFADEHEVRLAIFVPIDGGTHVDFEICTDEGKEYLYIKLEKDSLYTITPSPINTEEQSRLFFEKIKRRGYELL